MDEQHPYTGLDGTEWERHPVDPAVRCDIERRLIGIEQDFQVRILYACESGSRGWGFASPDSDYDVRFIYVHSLAWYLSVLPGRDVIELPVNAVLDIGGWELRKALALHMGGNAVVAEWLDSPIQYRADQPFFEAARAALGQVFRPERVFHHYYQMARRTYEEGVQNRAQVRLKKYFYVLRSLLAAQWVVRFASLPPMVFERLRQLLDDAELQADIDHLLAIKCRTGEAHLQAPVASINAYIERELAALAQWQPARSERRNPAVLDELLASMVVRQGFE